MRVIKTTLCRLESVYAVTAVGINQETHLLAASEGRGPCLLLSPPNWTASVVWDGPGGTLEVIPLAGRNGAIVAIQNFFPVYRSENACVVYAEPSGDIRDPWKVEKILDLPFVHRIAVVRIEEKDVLIAGTLCGEKESQDDWSSPGAVYAGEVAYNVHGEMSISCVLGNLTRNHGMRKARLGNQEVVLVSGAEGVFVIRKPKTLSESWITERVIATEVSDVYVGDLDNDGAVEILTIEPFHGDEVVLYKDVGANGWAPVFRTQAEFGHVVWGGSIFGKGSIIIGSRGGRKDLALLTVTSLDPYRVERTTIDKDVAPTAIEVLHHQHGEWIFSANHGANEVALYELVP